MRIAWKRASPREHRLPSRTRADAPNFSAEGPVGSPPGLNLSAAGQGRPRSCHLHPLLPTVLCGEQYSTHDEIKSTRRSTFLYLSFSLSRRSVFFLEILLHYRGRLRAQLNARFGEFISPYRALFRRRGVSYVINCLTLSGVFLPPRCLPSVRGNLFIFIRARFMQSAHNSE